jgi:dTDP-4-dehydrorhamnose 3,5-epimerase
MRMEYLSQKDFEDVKIGIRPKFDDDRGWFSELYDDGWKDMPYRFCKDNVSRSQAGTLRGLHFQNPNPQGKLVTVLQGSVIDFFVDLRQESETFGKWGSFKFNEHSAASLYVPEGFAHGFYVTGTQDAIFHYKCTDIYNPKAEKCLNFFDEEIGIDFDFSKYTASEKDLRGKMLKDFKPEELF